MGQIYVPPEFNKSGFHCPFCGAYAKQKWYACNPLGTGFLSSFQNDVQNNLFVCLCSHCSRYSIWFREEKIYPISSSAPLPSEDMPEDVKEDYEEARSVVEVSPRSAAALLRLALQKLMIHLGESGKNLNDDIANLVKKGLPEKIQKALDAVRVVGNNAVHPGELDLRDDKETALALFDLLNMIVEVMITQPKKVDEIYKKLPEGAKEAIERRDNNK